VEVQALGQILIFIAKKKYYGEKYYGETLVE